MYPFLVNPVGIPHAHNLFLQIAVALGLAGLIAWLAIVISVIAGTWAVYRRGRSTGDSEITGTAAGLLCSQGALVLHGLIDATMWGHGTHCHHCLGTVGVGSGEPPRPR